MRVHACVCESDIESVLYCRLQCCIYVSVMMYKYTAECKVCHVCGHSNEMFINAIERSAQYSIVHCTASVDRFLQEQFEQPVRQLR